LATTAWKSKRDVVSSHFPLALSEVEGLHFLCEGEGQAFDFAQDKTDWEWV